MSNECQTEEIYECEFKFLWTDNERGWKCEKGERNQQACKSVKNFKSSWTPKDHKLLLIIEMMEL